jgi:hypothetical protein
LQVWKLDQSGPFEHHAIIEQWDTGSWPRRLLGRLRGSGWAQLCAGYLGDPCLLIPILSKAICAPIRG